MSIPQKILQSVLLGVDRGKWEGGSRGFEGCVYLVGRGYLLYACYTLDTNICFLRGLCSFQIVYLNNCSVVRFSFDPCFSVLFK